MILDSPALSDTFINKQIIKLFTFNISFTHIIMEVVWIQEVIFKVIKIFFQYLLYHHYSSALNTS